MDDSGIAASLADDPHVRSAARGERRCRQQEERQDDQDKSFHGEKSRL
jgi:hypothetical protein